MKILFLERREGKEKERERNINVQEKEGSVASLTPPTRDWTWNPGMGPDQESNQWHGLQDDAQPTEPRQSAQKIKEKKCKWKLKTKKKIHKNT